MTVKFAHSCALVEVGREIQAQDAEFPFQDISCIRRIQLWLRLHLGSLLSDWIGAISSVATL